MAFHIVGLYVQAVDATLGRRKNTELDGQKIVVVIHTLQRLSNDQFTFTAVVKFTGIEKGDPLIQCGMDGSDRVFGISHNGHTHGSKSKTVQFDHNVSSLDN